MKIKFSPQVYLKKDIEYVYGEEQILAKVYKVTFDESNEEIDREIENTFYADFSKIEYGKIYPVNMPLSNVSRDENGELYIEVINYIGYEATEEEAFPKEFTPSIKDFEIPEDAEIIKLEEMVITEPESEPGSISQIIAKNKALEVKLESMKRQLEEDRRMNEETTLELLELMMGLL